MGTRWDAYAHTHNHVLHAVYRRIYINTRLLVRYCSGRVFLYLKMENNNNKKKNTVSLPNLLCLGVGLRKEGISPKRISGFISTRKQNAYSSSLSLVTSPRRDVVRPLAEWMRWATRSQRQVTRRRVVCRAKPQAIKHIRNVGTYTRKKRRRRRRRRKFFFFFFLFSLLHTFIRPFFTFDLIYTGTFPPSWAINNENNQRQRQEGATDGQVSGFIFLLLLFENKLCDANGRNSFIPLGIRFPPARKT